MATVLLTFDIEEFDLPREHGVDITVQQSVAVSAAGTGRLLDLLARHGVQATCFCTVTFAQHAPQLVQRMTADGHEVASHGMNHWQPAKDAPLLSRPLLQQISGQDVVGYRQPRMMDTDNALLRQAGYTYNASLNPSFIPGRYMHLTTPRTCHVRDGVAQIPASVTPWLRLPLFWLSLHHLPQGMYHWMAHRVLQHDGYFMTYFHPWELCPLSDYPQYHVPHLIARRCGDSMLARLDRLITHLQQQGCEFSTCRDFLATHPL